MDKSEMQKRIKTEEDYIRCPKCNNSLNKFIAIFGNNIENGKIEDGQIARLLMISEEEVKATYDKAVKVLRERMKEDEN